jgi:UDP-2-acetamido-3-amino-2,3-dideoxy-glucuronate N-acetyltransferase
LKPELNSFDGCGQEGGSHQEPDPTRHHGPSKRYQEAQREQEEEVPDHLDDHDEESRIIGPDLLDQLLERYGVHDTPFRRLVPWVPGDSQQEDDEDPSSDGDVQSPCGSNTAPAVSQRSASRPPQRIPPIQATSSPRGSIPPAESSHRESSPQRPPSSAASLASAPRTALLWVAAMPARPFIHPSAIVEQGASVGPGTSIWHRSHVRAGSRIGADCTIGFAVYVDTEVVVGDRCKIQNHVSLFRGVTLEDDVLVGPAGTFSNDLYPRATSGDWEVVPTHVRRGASIGANATIVCGVELGTWSMIAAGAVVTTDVPPHALVAGVPGRVLGWVCVCGRRVAAAADPLPDSCPRCGRTAEEMMAS